MRPIRVIDYTPATSHLDPDEYADEVEAMMARRRAYEAEQRRIAAAIAAID